MVFVGISVQDTEDEAKRFVADNGFAFSNGRDADLRIARAYRVQATPTAFLITPGGQILERHEGAYQEERLVEALQALVGFKGS